MAMDLVSGLGLEVSSGVGDLNAIMVKYLSDSRKLHTKYQQDLVALSMKAESDAREVVAREPELAVGD